MRITLVTGPFYPTPPAPCGAVERIWHGLGEQFAAAGHEVTVLCRHWPGQGRDEVLNGVRYVRRLRLSHTKSIHWDLAQDAVYSLRMLAALPAADVTVTNVFWLPTMIGLLRRRRAGKLVVHVARFPKGQMKLYGSADRLAACSQAIADAIVAECPSAAGRTVAFPNPIRTDAFSPRDRSGREGQGSVIFTGRIHPEKGLDWLVEAVGTLRRGGHPALRLRLIGPSAVGAGGGGADFVRTLRTIESDHGGGYLEVAEPLSDMDRLADALADADVYCYPTRAERGEASPVAPLEAMATGLPPVVSDLPQFRGYLRPGENGVTFEHRGVGAAGRLAGAIGGLLADPARAAAMGRRAAADAAVFSYAAVARLYLDDFAALTRSKVPAP